MGSSNSKNNSETINWNAVKTENMSSSLPLINSLSSDAKELIASLNIPEITESEVSENNINKILNTINSGLNQDDKQKFAQILDQVSSQSEDLSETSPFISSDMYNYLMNSKSPETNQTNQTKPLVGGNNKLVRTARKINGGALDNDSSTSSTSSDSSIEEILDTTEEEIIKKKKEKGKGKKKKDSDDSELSGGELSYLSSSAHTGGEFSDSHNSVESSSNTQTSNKTRSSKSSKSSQSYKSVTDENEMASTTVSVNTEDINMVSDY